MFRECSLPPGGTGQHHAGQEGHEACTERQERRVTLLRRAVQIRVDLLTTVVERRSLAGELSLSCARPAADG